MNIALLDKDLFANLLRFGEIILPEYSFCVVSEDLPIESALRLILKNGNPIEYPSQYIIVLYECPTHLNLLQIGSVKELIATDADGNRQFTSQFREDLIIKPEKYKSIFQEYLEGFFHKAMIKKGIASFRTLCGLEVADNYDEEINIIHRGISNRIKYRHHYLLPAGERVEPYVLMISYDRHAPYPSRGWVGYFYDVMELFCYYRDPNLGYSEMVIEGTSIFKKICTLPQDLSSKQIVAAIEDEKFTQLCNEVFSRPGGYLVPYIFFILRDRFRESESFVRHVDLIEQIKKQFPDAFDTASIFIGGFFGYEKFYDDYYSSLNLPIFNANQSFHLPGAEVSVLPDPKKNFEEIDSMATKSGAESVPSHEAKHVVSTSATSDIAAEDAFGFKKSNNPNEQLSMTPKEVLRVASDQSKEPQSLAELGLEGKPLYKKLYTAIELALPKSAKIKIKLLSVLDRYKDDDKKLQEIYFLFDGDSKKDLIKKEFEFDRYPGSEIAKIREQLKKI